MPLQLQPATPTSNVKHINNMYLLLLFRKQLLVVEEVQKTLVEVLPRKSTWKALDCSSFVATISVEFLSLHHQEADSFMQTCFAIMFLLRFLAIFYNIRKKLAAAEEILKEKEVDVVECKGGKLVSEGQRARSRCDQSGRFYNQIAKRRFFSSRNKKFFPVSNK